jgi:hypothetical protein
MIVAPALAFSKFSVPVLYCAAVGGSAGVAALRRLNQSAG